MINLVREMKKYWFRTTVTLIAIAMATMAMAQVGGNLTPLRLSQHTYSIQMGDVNFTPNWGLYPEGTTTGDIENNTATALVPGTDYTVIDLPLAERIVGGRSYWRVQFNRNIVANTNYVIGYKETTADANECLTAVIQAITVHPEFDVDVALADPDNDKDRCGDPSSVLQQTVGVQQTSISYRVWIEHPQNPPGYVESGGTGYWRFRFDITATGRGSLPNRHATIAGITATGTGMDALSWTPAAGSSSFYADVQVSPSSVTPVNFTVVFNEVLGVTQDINFTISAIQGAFLEPDVDEVNNTLENNNIVTNVIYGMPNVGPLVALN